MTSLILIVVCQLTFFFHNQASFAGNYEKLQKKKYNVKVRKLHVL